MVTGGAVGLVERLLYEGLKLDQKVAGGLPKKIVLRTRANGYSQR